MKVIVKTKKSNLIPKYATEGSSGADLMANIEEDIILKAQSSILIPTGIFLEIPKGYEAQIRPRSGLALNDHITVLNTPGTIDSDYRDEVKVILFNHGKKDFVVKKNMRIAQMVISKVVLASFEIKDKLSFSKRGGFGSTGL